jgi:hypothetical protein
LLKLFRFCIISSSKRRYAETERKAKTLMFSLEQTEIARAIEAAKKLHPVVKMVRFGEYLVSGSTGGYYTVRCFRDRGYKVVECTCKTRDGIACKHGVAAVSLHIGLASLRRAA